MSRFSRTWLALLILPGFASSVLHAQAPADLSARVLVVYNAGERQSKDVAQYYLKQRNIPAANLCAVRPALSEGAEDGTVLVPASDLEKSVLAPVRKCIEKAGKKQILYIVLAYKFPYRIRYATENHGQAVDQQIADIWNELNTTGQRVENPYFNPANPKTERYGDFVSFADFRNRPGSPVIYSVWRLEGAAPEVAKGLVSKAMEAEQKGASGQACFDRRYGDITRQADTSYTWGDWDIYRAAFFAKKAGLPVLEDDHEQEFGTSPAPLRCDNAILYAGWYSTRYNDAFSWNVGGLGFHLDSSSATNPRGTDNWSGGALAKGITVTAGSVNEPYLTGLPRPGGIVHDLLQGANVGDALLRNTAWLKWMDIYIGDPLYRPFAHGVPAQPTKK